MPTNNDNNTDIKTTSSDLVLAPGPVNLHPLVQTALALPMIHHRTPEFDKILKKVLQNLKLIFQTKESVFVTSSTGSGGMEALLVNVLSFGDEILSIDSGKFGERWAEMATVFGAKVHILKTQWGKAVEVDDVAAALKKNPNLKIVMCQACETSTGTAHPIQKLGELIQQYPNTLFLVDGITALGAYPLPMDEWHIDGLVGGSQKAFMLPTGLSLFSFSQKAWKKIATSNAPKFYFDVRKEKKANDNGETYFSSNVTLIRALDVVLDLILSQGLPQHFATIHSRADFTRELCQFIGFKLYSSSPADSLTALLCPDGIDSQKIRLALEQNHHITIMGGQDQAKGKVLRIGHMGHIQKTQMDDLILKLYQTTNEFFPNKLTSRTVDEIKAQMQGYNF
jgi:aspartate aminotransferase-like enzyme